MSFISIAISLQEEAETPRQANRCFRNSCRMCGERGLVWIPCDQCPIRSAHERTMDIFRMREESDKSDTR